MTLNCTRCDGSGFVNIHLVPESLAEEGDCEVIREWAASKDGDSDVTVCNCCGDGEEEWYGTPGEHYGPDDPQGLGGPYESNGGLCRCH